MGYKKSEAGYISTKKKIVFSIIITIIIFLTVFIIGETLTRLFCPQHYIYPRWEYSPVYGHMLFKNCEMIFVYSDGRKFTQTTNEYRYKGRAIPVSNSYDKENVIVFGDSYSFSNYIDNGKEYAAIMADKLL